MRFITDKITDDFLLHLQNSERAQATAEKYVREVKRLREYGQDGIDREILIEYKHMICCRYSPRSVNVTISALNSFFDFCGWRELRLSSLKIQKQIFTPSERMLTVTEYQRLLAVAQTKNPRLFLVLQTVCSCGIRISELEFITVSAVCSERAQISCKGKHRVVFLPSTLCKLLRAYIKEKKIKSGPVFVTRNGRPLDRSNIWSDMKKLCERAGVSEKKVFPHNLRHLFARTYYSKQKDIVRLSDILGHSNINTTRIYTMENGEVHKRHIQSLGLLMC